MIIGMVDDFGLMILDDWSAYVRWFAVLFGKLPYEEEKKKEEYGRLPDSSARVSGWNINIFRWWSFVLAQAVLALAVLARPLALLR